MAASTSTCADSNNSSCYDVFISHRGPDVKKTFASHLYRRLYSHGLRVFLDYQELQEGENFPGQIKSAIRAASVHVAIFSPTYADSSWCLNELLFMLESGAPIIPVFHHVKPTELRRTQGEGVYATSLSNLEKKRGYDCEPRYDSKTIENWRNALSRVADISGFDLEAFNGDEGELLVKLVEVVLKKGKKKLNVARYPSGLDHKVEAFEAKLSWQRHNEIQFVGITGLGGVGKTTLAKQVFNRKISKYSKSSFLFDVREKAKNNITSLQRKLLKDLSASEEPIDSKDEGLEILRKHFSVLSDPVLLVLDDVDHEDQVYALLTATDKGTLPLPASSLILVTSRDTNVLRMSGVEVSSIYKLTGLNKEHSRELFCMHAFCQPQPLTGFEDLVDKFLRACNGLPLSLKVMGGLLYENTDKSSWKDELERLEQILPYEIQKRLQISYDALQVDEKQMFLDIACFFIGEDRDTAIRVWDGSGWKGSRGFKSLMNKCLVEVEVVEHFNVRNYIRMHDHLRDLGRDLAKSSGFPCRLWCGTKHIDDMLQQSYEAIRVRGIRMLPWEHYHDDQSVSFSGFKMKGLQLLDIGIEKDLLKCLLEAVDSPNLLCFSWRDCPCTSLPPCIPMRTLRVLKVSGPSLETLWQEELQAPLQLRELQINAPLSKIPKSIGQLKHLEWMAVSSSSGLIVEIPKEFCDLRSLKHLQLRISNMRSLPDSFGDLSSLQNIDLSYCGALERLPDSFGDLSKLEHIDLRRCHSLERLPDSFGDLSSLQHIDLSYCRAMERLPDSFGNLSKLEHLDLSHSTNLERLPDSFGTLIKLKHLDLSNCWQLTLSRGTFGKISTLEYINLICCYTIEVLPSQIAHQRSLEILDLNLPNLKEWPTAIGEPSSLEKLVIETPLLESLPPSLGSDLVNLKYLELRSCQSLKFLPDSFLMLNQLIELTVSDCSLQELPFKTVEGESETLADSGGERTLSNLKTGLLQLQKIKLHKMQISEVSFPPGVCPNLQQCDIRDCQDLVEVGKLPNGLIRLELIDCPKLMRIELQMPPSLTTLKVYWCPNLSIIQGMAQLAKLRELEISELEELSDVQHLRSLQRLKACNCEMLKRIPGLALLTELRELEISHLAELEELSGVQHLRSLQRLEACNCVKLKRIPGLALLTELRQLDVSFCYELEELPGVEHLRSLEWLKACNCVKLKRIRGLEQLTQLRKLDVSGCYELEELPGVEHLRSLKSLKACNCVKLKRIRGSEQLTQLRELDVSFCYELEELQGIEHLRSLEWLKVCNCVKLKTIQGSAQLTELQELNVSFCSELEELPSVDHLKSLKKFQARSCKKLKSIRGSGQQTQLLELKLFDCSELEELPVLEHLKSLEVLQVCNCVKLKRIQGLAQLTKVRELDVSECYDLEQLSGVEHLRSLNKLRAHSCVKLERIRVSAQLTQLRELDVSFCYGLEELPGVGHLKSLAVLRASGCVNLKSIAGLAQLTQLQELHVSFCYWLEELLDVGHLKSLKVLRASGFLNLTTIRGLEQLTQLRELDVSGCSELEEVPGVENLKSLEVLRASVCVKLKSIQGLERLALLRELEVSHCDELEELLGVQHLKLLEKLQAFGCRKLKSIRGLELLTKLRELDVSGCYELEELPSLEQLRSLEVLKACNCVKLKSIQGLALLSQLRKLYVSGCSELEELPGMRYLMSLDTLKACNCVKLKSIQGSARLRELDVSGCSELEEMDVEELQSLAVLRASKCVSLKCLRGLSRLTNLRTLDVTGIPTKVCVLDTLWQFANNIACQRNLP